MLATRYLLDRTIPLFDLMTHDWIFKALVTDDYFFSQLLNVIPFIGALYCEWLDSSRMRLIMNNSSMIYDCSEMRKRIHLDGVWWNLRLIWLYSSIKMENSWKGPWTINTIDDDLTHDWWWVRRWVLTNILDSSRDLGGWNPQAW